MSEVKDTKTEQENLEKKINEKVKKHAELNEKIVLCYCP